MVFRYSGKDALWIDLEKPTPEELRAVASELGISERIETELADPTPSSLATVDGATACLVLHLPSAGKKYFAERQEVDFAIGPRSILTVHYEVIPAIHRLTKLVEAGRLGDSNTASLLETILLDVLASMRDQANHVASRLSHVEQAMFAGRERTSVLAIAEINREFLHLEAALASQEPLSRLLEALSRQEFFGASFREQAAHIEASWAQVSRLVDTYRAIATELRETNVALLNARQNQIMKTLTAVTFFFIVFPLSLVANVFAIRIPGIPLVNDPNGFWIVLGILFMILGVLALFFTRKRWLS